MTLAPWRSPLARALHRNRSQPHSRYFQLATVRADGRPANRTVVFRGFWGETNQLKIVTDARSAKANQIEDSAWGEACWYFTETREQFRLSGRLRLVRDNPADDALKMARQQSWQELSEAARVQFAWPDSGQARSDATAFNPAPPDPIQPLPWFCLVLLDPVEVDHLELRGEPQNRYRYQLHQTDWSVMAINP